VVNERETSKLELLTDEAEENEKVVARELELVKGLRRKLCIGRSLVLGFSQQQTQKDSSRNRSNVKL